MYTHIVYTCSMDWRCRGTSIYMYMHVSIVSYIALATTCIVAFTDLFHPRKYIQHEGSTIPCTVKTMIQLTCTDRPYKANHYSARMSLLYSTVHTDLLYSLVKIVL